MQSFSFPPVIRRVVLPNRDRISLVANGTHNLTLLASKADTYLLPPHPVSGLQMTISSYNKKATEHRWLLSLREYGSTDLRESLRLLLPSLPYHSRTYINADELQPMVFDSR